MNSYDQAYSGGWNMYSIIDESMCYDDILENILADYISFSKNLGDSLPNNIFDLSEKHRNLLIKKHIMRTYTKKHLKIMSKEEESHIEKKLSDFSSLSHIVIDINQDINKYVAKKILQESNNKKPFIMVTNG